MAISDRITSIEEHIKESYQELEGIGIDTTGVNKNLENIPKLIDGYWETLPKVTGEGTTITLDNTKEGKMKIVLKGNTSQEGTPTPEAPQDIHVVSGDNSIEVCGKNLFDIDSSLDGKYYESDGTMHTATNAFGELIPISPTSMSYTIKNNSTTTVRDYVFIFDENMNRISGPRWGSTVNAGATITLENLLTTNAKYIAISVLGLSPSSKEQIEIQLEKGTATTYEPYTGESYLIILGDIELCKIGNYQDSIVKDNGKWYLHKEIGKVILNGSESWSDFSVGDTNFRCQYDVALPNILTPPTNPAQLFSNYFKAINRDNAYAKTEIGIAQYGSALGKVFICAPNTILSEQTLASWKTWLSTHNTIVYYVLNTPTTTEITDSTLLSQLNALAKSYTGQTNISQENNDLASLLNATALEEME